MKLPACSRLATSRSSSADDKRAHDGEHSLEVQVPFIRWLFPEARIVPIAVLVTAAATALGQSMCCGIVGTDLVVPVGPDGYEGFLAESHARPMDFTGRPLAGMVYVSPAGLRTAKTLHTWIDRALRFFETLPPQEE